MWPCRGLGAAPPAPACGELVKIFCPTGRALTACPRAPGQESKVFYLDLKRNARGARARRAGTLAHYLGLPPQAHGQKYGRRAAADKAPRPAPAQGST